jgi:ATP-binding cassette subfamily D (ALD) protein 3
MGLGTDPTKLMEDYSRNGKSIFFSKSPLILIYKIASYLVNLSQAIGRLILTGRDLTRFAGYTVIHLYLFLK